MSSTRPSRSFFFTDTETTEIYTLSLHDALPISAEPSTPAPVLPDAAARLRGELGRDRKSTRLNTSHMSISYAVYCLKKKRLMNDRTSVDGPHLLRFSRVSPATTPSLTACLTKSM